jgi:hypothetical protein
MTEYFDEIQSTHTKRPSTYQPVHRTLAQQPLLFGDNPT